MKRVLTTFSLSLITLIFLSGCTTGPCKVITILNHCPNERQYLVYGRVVDLQCNPVENCKVILIKRKFGIHSKQSEDLGQYQVALTNKTGEYSFCFEPLGANDVWLYFDARDRGYNPQFIELNHLMGPTIFQAPGNSPIVVNMTLEKAS